MSPARGSSRGEHFATKLQVLANLARNSVAMNGPSLVEFLQRFRAHGEQCAYVHRRGYRTERWSYRDVYDRAVQFSNELSERGIQKGDKILLTLTHRKLPNRDGMVGVMGGWHAHLAILVEKAHGRTPDAFWDVWRRTDGYYETRVPR